MNVNNKIKRGAVKRESTAQTGIYRIKRYNPNVGRYELPKSGKKFTATKVLIIEGRKKQIEKSFSTLLEASEWRQFGEQTLVLNSIAKITFSDLVNEFFDFMNGKVRESTLLKNKSYVKHLRVLMNVKLSEFSPRLIDQWLKTVKDPEYLKLSHKTRESYLKEIKFLRQMFNFATDYIDSNIKNPILKRHNRDSVICFDEFKKNRQQRASEFLTQDEWGRFENAFMNLSSKNTFFESYYLLAKIQVQTGLRISEAAALSWDDLQLEGNSPLLHIRKSVMFLRGKGQKSKVFEGTKTYESRHVPLSKELLKDLNQWKLKCGRREGLMFSNDGLEPLNFRSIDYAYNKAFELADLKYRGTHVLRHTFATLFLKATRDQVALKGILGHRQLAQTDHYAKIVLSSVTDVAKIFHDDFNMKIGI